MDNIKDHKFIVFCEDHYNPLGIVRSLGFEGITPDIILVGEHAYTVGSSKYVGKLHLVKTDEDGLEVLLDKYGNINPKPFLMTGSDRKAEFLDMHYDMLKDKFYLANGGYQGGLVRNNEKDIQIKIAEECGLPAPKGCICKKGEMPVGLRYPVLTKVTQATKGAWKGDVFICDNEQELKEAYSKIQADEVIVQEFIEKKNELCVDGISIDGGREVFVSYTSEYIRFTRKSFGDFFWMKKYENEAVKEKIRNIIRKANYSGIFCLECLIDKNDDLYFLECNYRNSGWSYAHTLGGVNLPVIWAQSTLDNHIDETRIKMEDKPYLAMVEPSEFITSVIRERQVSLFGWIKDLRRCKVTFYYHKEDKKPLFGFLFGRFMYSLKHLF